MSKIARPYALLISDNLKFTPIPVGTRDEQNPKFEIARIESINLLSLERINPPSPVENPFVAWHDTIAGISLGLTVENEAVSG